MNKKKLNWKIIDPLLGKISDLKIAAMYNVSISPIYRRRTALGIPAYAMGQEMDWGPIDALLTAGASIKDVCAEFNIASPRLNKRCKKLGIIRKKPEPPWKDIDPLLGKEPDADIAREFNLTPLAVFRRRRELGIPSLIIVKEVDWSEIDPYLGTCTDRELAEEAGILTGRVANRRRSFDIPPFIVRAYRKEEIYWKAIEPYLGTMTDRQIADKFHISAASVGKKRRKLGIEVYKPPPDWRKDRVIFSNMSDLDIAKKYNVSSSAANAARSKLGMTTPKRDLSFIDEYLDSLSDAEIAEKFDLKIKAVYDRRLRVKRRTIEKQNLNHILNTKRGV